MDIYYYLFTCSLILIASYFGNTFRQIFSSGTNKDDYEMVKKYLLNESPLYGKNRPKLWIHSKYAVNARHWKNFMSRSSTDLNQPYLFLTVQSVINHCGDDFHICLIDDETFVKLIPDWDIDISTMADPMKTHVRDIAMMELVYHYGGMVLPNSFLCTKNLIDFYKTGTENGIPFVVEQPNRHVNTFKDIKQRLFVPDISIIGAPKNDITIKEIVHRLKMKYLEGQQYFSNEIDFCGEFSEICLEAIRTGAMRYVGGETIGVKNRSKKPILLEDLMEDKYLDVDMKTLYGVLIPREELLRRPKYQWFSILPVDDVLSSSTILAKFFKMSMVESSFELKDEKSIAVL